MNGPLLTQRRVQVSLGLIWLLDAALQFQPYMFTRDFLTELVRGAMYQPHAVQGLMFAFTRPLVPHAAAANAVFATTQLLIGAGLLWRRTVHPALVVSFVWVLCVWVVGEGFGGLFSGVATLVGGAPGAVLLYGLIGLLVWPRGRRDQKSIVTSVAAEGPLGERGGRVIWAVLWSGGAVLQVFPGPYPPFSVLEVTINMLLPQPAFLTQLDQATSSFINRAGNPLEVFLAAVEVLIGILVLRSGRWVRPALWVGIALSLVFWVVGQNFGGVLAGEATDPNAGPLYVLLALTLYPTRAPADAIEEQMAKGRLYGE